MTGILLVDVVLVLAVIVLAPWAVASVLLVAAAAATAISDGRSKRRMRRTLDDLLKERT